MKGEQKAFDQLVSDQLVSDQLVSVVIPTYNRAHLIIDALNSVYRQSYRPIELVVVDDGSKDDTTTVVRDWFKTHAENYQFSCRYIQQDNLGGNPARNRGIKESTGSFIAFLDSDDSWHPQKLEKQMAAFDGNSKIGGVYCGLRHVFYESGIIQSAPPREYPSGQLLHQMLVHDVTAPTSTYILRAEVFDKVGCFDEQLLARQDWDMWIRLAAEFEIGVVPEVLVDFKEHSGTRTASNPQKEIDAYRTIMGKYRELRARCPLSIRQAAKASFYRRMGRVHFHQEISATYAFTYYVQAILSWPFTFDSYAALVGMMLPAKFRQFVHISWNRLFGATKLSIKSH